MQIYCPKCKTAYQIDDGLIDEVRKVRCANCHEIFNPQDFRVSVNLQVEAIDDEIEVSAARTVERELPAEPDLLPYRSPKNLMILKKCLPGCRHRPKKFLPQKRRFPVIKKPGTKFVISSDLINAETINIIFFCWR